jgi:hypothetical protein
MAQLIRSAQLSTAFCSSGSQYLTAILGAHSFSEAVLIFSLSIGGLEGSFHGLFFLKGLQI